MFNNRINYIEKQVSRLASEVNKINHTIKQLVCKHERVEFNYSQTFSGIYYRQTCPYCNKVLQTYDSEVDYRNAIVKKREAQLLIDTTKLKKAKAYGCIKTT